jgi:hypothetical protein
MGVCVFCGLCFSLDSIDELLNEVDNTPLGKQGFNLDV